MQCKFRGYRTAWIYTSAYPRVVFRNAETCINPPMGITADALECGSLWTYSYRNAKSHFTVDPHGILRVFTSQGYLKICCTTGTHKSVELQSFAHLRHCRPTYFVADMPLQVSVLHRCSCFYTLLQSRRTTVLASLIAQLLHKLEWI